MLLCSSLAIAQEADELGGSGAELSVIARAEYLHGDPLGNTSLYTLLEGNISDNLSYSVCNHWLSSAPGDLYAATFHSDETNWLDWATLTYSLESFEFSVGKDCMPWGTYEMDENDWDVHYPFASSIWNNLSNYQWGAMASWIPREEITFGFRFCSSPYSVKPFEDALFTYSVLGKYDNPDAFGLMLAYNLVGTAPGSYEGVFSAGAKAYLGNATVTADFNNRVGDYNAIFLKGFTSALHVAYAFSDAFELVGHAAYERIQAGNLEDMTGGLALHYYPIEGLRVHALGAWRYGDIAPGPTFSIGVTYNLNLSL